MQVQLRIYFATKIHPHLKFTRACYDQRYLKTMSIPVLYHFIAISKIGKMSFHCVEDN